MFFLSLQTRRHVFFISLNWKACSDFSKLCEPFRFGEGYTCVDSLDLDLVVVFDPSVFQWCR